MGKSILKEPLNAYNKFELGINKKYAISGTVLPKLRDFLNRKSISADYLYNDQSEYLVSLRAYPFWMEKFFDGIGEYSTFPIGPFSANEVKVKGKELSSQSSPVLLGEIDINRHYYNFMDFAPYTKISAYIPYISFVDLPVNEIMGKHIKFYGQVDFDNGILTVWLEVNDTMIQSWESPIGIEINLNRTNGSDWARNMYLWSIKSITGTGSLMVSGATHGTADFGKSLKMGGDVSTGYIGANQRHVSRGGYSNGINKLYSPTSIYIIYEREIPNEENVEIQLGKNSYASLYGLPLMKNKFLSELKGFTVINNIHLDNFTDTLENEKNEIDRLLRSGVIL